MRINWNDIPDGQFEEVIAALMRSMGYENVTVRTGGMDDGWDIDAQTRQRHPDGTFQLGTWRVECKRYRNSPSAEKIRDHYTRMIKTDVVPNHVLFVTTSSFSNPTKRDLKEFSKHDRVDVSFWERTQLDTLVEEHLHDSPLRILIAKYVDHLIPLDLLQAACAYQVTSEIETRVRRKYLPELCRARPIETEIEQFIACDLKEEQSQELGEVIRAIRMPPLEAAAQAQWRNIIQLITSSKTLEETDAHVKELQGLCDKDTKESIKQIRDGVMSLQRNCFFIKDKAGSGKTNLLCRLANLSRPEKLTIFLSCKFDLPASGSLEEIVLKALYVALDHQQDSDAYDFSISTNPSDLFKTLFLSLQNHQQELVIFLDGVNEHRNLSALDEAIIAILSRWNGVRIKFVITCRDIFWGFFSANVWSRFFHKRTIHDLPGFDDSQIDGIIAAYFAAFNIKGSLVGVGRNKCRHPLLLRFFCEAHRDQDIRVFEDLRLKDLFEVYWNRKLQEISEALALGQDGGRRVEDFLFRILNYMSEQYATHVPLGEIQQLTGETDLESNHSLYQHFLDQDIILEEMPPSDAFDRSYTARRISFVYDEFYDYMMALHRVRSSKWDDLNPQGVCLDFLELVKRSGVFEQLQGVAEYLILIAEQKKMHRSLCATLAQLGNYTIICNVLPKLKDRDDWVADIMRICLLSLPKDHSESKTTAQLRYDKIERTLTGAEEGELYESLLRMR
jgi:restriction endonuclease